MLALLACAHGTDVCMRARRPDVRLSASANPAHGMCLDPFILGPSPPATTRVMPTPGEGTFPPTYE